MFQQLRAHRSNPKVREIAKGRAAGMARTQVFEKPGA